MKRLPLFLALLFTTPSLAQDAALPLPWVVTTEIYVTTTQARIYPNSPINLITGASPARGPQTPGTWTRVDLKPWGIAGDAKWAELSGVLIITHGTTPETADLRLTFRFPGDNATDCTKYIGQVTEAAVGSGQRSTMTVTVPLVNGEFEWCYQKTTSGTWPTNSSYGVNMVVSKWGR